MDGSTGWLHELIRFQLTLEQQLDVSTLLLLSTCSSSLGESWHRYKRSLSFIQDDLDELEYLSSLDPESDLDPWRLPRRFRKEVDPEACLAAQEQADEQEQDGWSLSGRYDSDDHYIYSDSDTSF